MTRALLSTLVGAALSSACALCTISGRVVGPGAAGLRVTLNGGERTAATLADGAFSFSATQPGKYFIEISSQDKVYPQYKVHVPESDCESIQALEYRYPGAPKLAVLHPLLAIAPVAPAAWYEERPRVTVWSLVANPTAIMMIVMAAMVFGMPLLTKNMDPAELRVMQEQQAAMGGGGDPFAAFSKLLSGGGGEEEGAAAAVGGSGGAARVGDGARGGGQAAAAAGGSSVRARQRQPAAGAR